MAILGLAALLAGPAGAQEAGVDDDTFYTTLSPYGRWVDVPGAGRVWQPSPDVVGADFQPYGTGGHWVYTDYGWSFESDYDWGWAPFHYGRWFWDTSFGWCWWPNRVWSPAWVDWRWGGGYVGWAPLAPVGFQVVVAPYHPYWTFVGTSVFVQPNVYHYAVPVGRVAGVYQLTSPVHATVGGGHWYAGPPPAHVAAAVGAPVPRASIAPPPPGHVAPCRAVLPPPGAHASFVTANGSVMSRPMTANEYHTFSPPAGSIRPTPGAGGFGNRGAAPPEHGGFTSHTGVAPAQHGAPVYNHPSSGWGAPAQHAGGQVARPGGSSGYNAYHGAPSHVAAPHASFGGGFRAPSPGRGGKHAR